MDKKELLIVDDDLGFLDLLQMVFKDQSMTLTCVDNPDDAVKAMQKKQHPVALLDFQLPSINGDELIPLLQNINPNAKFVILTGLDDSSIEERFKGLGYYAFFQKGSIEVEKLRSTILDAFKS